MNQSWMIRVWGLGLILTGTLCVPLTTCASDQKTVPAIPGRIVVLGDSITSGYGLEDPGTQAYPALLSEKITEAGWSYQVVNAGVSGDTTAGGLGRIQWALKDGADVLVVALGGNDGLRGVPPQTTASNLTGIIRASRQQQPGASVIVAGMKMPDSMGATFARAYAAVFPSVAAQEKTSLIPYFLQGVGGVARLNQPDRIHPTVEGQRVIAENVWKILRPVLEARHKARETVRN